MFLELSDHLQLCLAHKTRTDVVVKTTLIHSCLLTYLAQVGESIYAFKKTRLYEKAATSSPLKENSKSPFAM